LHAGFNWDGVALGNSLKQLFALYRSTLGAPHNEKHLHFRIRGPILFRRVKHHEGGMQMSLSVELVRIATFGVFAFLAAFVLGVL